MKIDREEIDRQRMKGVSAKAAMDLIDDAFHNVVAQSLTAMAAGLTSEGSMLWAARVNAAHVVRSYFRAVVATGEAATRLLSELDNPSVTPQDAGEEYLARAQRAREDFDARRRAKEQQPPERQEVLDRQPGNGQGVWPLDHPSEGGSERTDGERGGPQEG